MRWLLLGMIGMVWMPVAQPEEETQRVAVSQVEQSRFDRDLEARLSRDIKAYLDHDFFIVQAKSLLEKLNAYETSKQKITVPVEPSAQQAKAQQQQDAARQELLNQMELETEDGINAQNAEQAEDVSDLALPGLPVSEQTFAQQTNAQQKQRQAQKQPMMSAPVPQMTPAFETREETKKELKDSRIDIKQLSVKVVLDNHVTPEQETFIRNLVIEKANVNFIRGDELRLVRTNFPGATVLDPKPVEEKAEDKEEKSVEPEKPLPTEAEKDAQQRALAWLEQYWPYLAAILALVLLWLMLRRNNKAQTNAPSAQTTPVSDSKDKLDAFIEKLSFAQDNVADQKLRALREELVSMTVTERNLFTGQMVDWLNAGGQEDVARVAAVVNLVGPGLMVGLLKGQIDGEKLMGLLAMAEELARDNSPSELMEKVEQAYQTLARRRLQENITEEHKIRPFDFLERLNDDQILYLLNDERMPVRALVYSQLPAERAAGLLKRIGGDDRAALAMEISRFSHLPAASFRDIANRLARKAVDVPSFANIAVDGVDVLIGMLDHLDSSEETALLLNVRQTNPDLYYRIKQVYISFNDLVSLPTLALKNLIREVSREDLAMALHDVDDTFRDTILASMLERPRAMLVAAIRDLKDVNPLAVNEAKRKVARRARSMLKAGEFKLPSPEAKTAQSTPKPKAATAEAPSGKPAPPAPPPPQAPPSK
ncbi:MAG: hypothetical protein OEW58_02310 [Gammaproteobacteria bacterium]|nr:hypothetical protein [Gammaproteobacteria bacterium]